MPDTRPDMRQRALFITSNAACRWKSKGGQRQFLYLEAQAAVAVGALPPPSKSERCMASRIMSATLPLANCTALPDIATRSQHRDVITAKSLPTRVCLGV